MIPQGAIAIYDGGANLHLDKDGKLNCGTINTQLTGNPGTVLVNKAIDNTYGITADGKAADDGGVTYEYAEPGAG